MFVDLLAIRVTPGTEGSWEGFVAPSSLVQVVLTGEVIDSVARAAWLEGEDLAASGRAESGFPVFQNVLELENDRKSADKRLAAIPAPDALREDMADFILRHKAFPQALQATMAERLYLQAVEEGLAFGPFSLAQTAKVSVNPKTMRPFYLCD